MKSDLHSKDLIDSVSKIKDSFSFKVEVNEIKAVNWNEKWETNFSPIIVGESCAVIAPYHKEQSVKHNIVLSPKMAFGTGHHETTWMMLARMGELDFTGKKVLDFGCGTGVLSIYAEKLGSTETVGIDIEEAAYQNTLENIGLNACQNIKVIKGDFSDIPTASYDVILANINRTVVLNSLSGLYDLLSNKGTLLVSGILKKDESTLENDENFKKFLIKAKFERNHWLCYCLSK